jgi:hypothetical protein
LLPWLAILALLVVMVDLGAFGGCGGRVSLAATSSANLAN